MNPLHKHKVSWISSKADLKISFLNSRLEMWVWKSGPKIDPATGVITVPLPAKHETVLKNM